jgi:hypothetical protein
LSHGFEALYLVIVDDRAKVAKRMVCREEDGFPIRSFVAFSVAQEYKHPVKSIIELCAVRHSSPDGKTVTQRACAELDTWVSLVRYVTAQIRAVLTMSVKFFNGEKSSLREDGVDSSTSVAFAQYETVAIGPTRVLRVNMKHAPIKHREQVGHR